MKHLLIFDNSNHSAAIVGACDDLFALQLKGNGDGFFKPILPNESGLTVRGESRNIIYLKGEGLTTLMFLKNQAPAQVFIKN